MSLLFAGCGSSEAITIDYSNYPENFMVALQPDTNYILKNGEREDRFGANTHALTNSSKVLSFNDQTYALEDAVKYRKTEPVLIHLNGKDYIWICEITKEGRIISATFFYESIPGRFGSDNGSLNVLLGDAVLDPSDFVMEKNMDCFVPCVTNAHYTLNEENGKPVELETEDRYEYPLETYTSVKYVLNDDIETWVYADKDATEFSIEKLPQGTVFTPFRVPKNEDYKYVEGLLEDGRVMRVIEEYWFSEPSPYHAMLDYNKQQFSFQSLEQAESAPKGFIGMNWMK